MIYHKNGQKPQQIQDSRPKANVSQEQKHIAGKAFKLLLDKAVGEENYEEAANLRNKLDSIAN